MLGRLHGDGGGLAGAVGRQVVGSVAQALSSLVDVLVVVILGLYLAANPEVYQRGLLHLVPPRHRPRARVVVLGVTDALRHWMLGELFQMALIGTVCGVGDWLLGVPEAPVLGVIAGLTEFIPNIGPILGAVPAVLLAFGVDPMHAAYVAVFYAVVQGLEGNILTPLVQKRAVDLPPVLTLGFQLVMGLMAGFLGLLIAVPLAACVMRAVQMTFVRDVLDDRSG
jgi:predicted PurR-regulated permease PerM